MKKKINLYVDGFNLYFGLSKVGRRYKWLSLIRVAEELCRADQKVGTVHYFTAKLKGKDHAKIKRQKIYLEALEETGVNVVYGKYQQKMVTCPRCKRTYPRYEEKESDVNLGATLLLDSGAKKADYYFVISGDSDLIYPMEAARDVYGCEVIPVFPPHRHSDEIKRRMGKFVPISEAFLRKCQLPEQIKKPSGYVLSRPKKWK